MINALKYKKKYYDDPRGYEINEFTPPDNIGNISATKVRDCIKEGDDSWKLMVDESIQEDIKKYLLYEK